MYIFLIIPLVFTCFGTINASDENGRCLSPEPRFRIQTNRECPPAPMKKERKIIAERNKLRRELKKQIKEKKKIANFSNDKHE